MRKKIALSFFINILFILSIQNSQSKIRSIGPLFSYLEDDLYLQVFNSKLNQPKLKILLKNKSINLSMEEVRKNYFRARVSQFATQNFRYQIIDSNYASPVYRYQAPKNAELSVAVYGDNRQGKGDPWIHEKLLSLMRASQPDLIVSLGDLVHRGDNLSYWKDLLNLMQPTLSTVPINFILGNHDLSKKNWFRKLLVPSLKKRNYYHFRVKSVDFIALDSNAFYAPRSPQYKYLTRLLSKLGDQGVIVVLLHHPVYSYSKHGHSQEEIKYLQPLFEKYKIDLVLAGHDHNFQYLLPKNGVHYIVSGGGGSKLYKVWPHKSLVSYKQIYHFLNLEFHKNKILLQLINSQGVLEEQFNLKYNH